MDCSLQVEGVDAKAKAMRMAPVAALAGVEIESLKPMFNRERVDGIGFCFFGE